MPIPVTTPAAGASLDRWHTMVATLDLSDVEELMAPEAVFNAPTFLPPYAGPHKVAHVLQTVMGIFEDFTYHRQFSTADGQSVVLEFSAIVGELKLKGIDMIRFDEQGQILEFEVLIRPVDSLIALGERMRDSLDLALLAQP
jgi:SnoaL-like protein